MNALRGRAAPQSEGLPEQFYRALAETIPHLVWSARSDGHHDFHNRQFQAYTGLSVAELTGRGWPAIVHPEDRERCRARWQHALARVERFEIECRLRRHDGAYLWHLGSAQPLQVEGRILRWFGTCTDIEDHKKANRMLDRARQSLETLLESRADALEAAQVSLLGSLSARERQVLRHTVEGKTIAQTAAQLGVSPKSVETYRSRVMTKLGIVDLPGLVKFAIRNGITTV
jgi:PAS domain S-box-containing protein